jgi:hypothetical protein
MNRTPRQPSPEQASALAQSAFLFLVADDERLGSFVALSGFDTSDARAAAASPGFLAGVLAHLLADESLLVAFAEGEGVHPLSVPLAYRVIPGGDPMLEITGAN